MNGVCWIGSYSIFCFPPSVSAWPQALFTKHHPSPALNTELLISSWDVLSLSSSTMLHSPHQQCFIIVNGVLYLACGVGLSVFLKSSVRYPFLAWYLLPFHNGTDVQRFDHKLVSSLVRMPSAPGVLEGKRQPFAHALVLGARHRDLEGISRRLSSLQPFAHALHHQENERCHSLAIHLDNLCCHSSYSVENAFKYNTQAVRYSYQSKTNNIQRKRHMMEQRW